MYICCNHYSLSPWFTQCIIVCKVILKLWIVLIYSIDVPIYFNFKIKV